MQTSRNKGKVNLLEAIPCRSSRVITEWEGETAVLSFPRFKRAWVQRFLVPKGMSKYIRVRLEEHGTAVWQLVDGRRTVADIIQALAPHFQGEAGYEARVSAYLCQLQKDGLVRLVVGRS